MRYGAIGGLNSFLVGSSSNIDILSLRHFRPESLDQLGIYTASFKYYALLLPLINTLITNVIGRSLENSTQSSDRYRHIISKTAIIFTVAVLVTIALAALSPILELILGPSFNGVQVVLSVLSLSYVPAAISLLFISAAKTMQTSYMLIVVPGTQSAMNLILNFFLLKFVPTASVAVALGTVLSYFYQLLLVYFIYKSSAILRSLQSKT